jgi:hypothetical protein
MNTHPYYIPVGHIERHAERWADENPDVVREKTREMLNYHHQHGRTGPVIALHPVTTEIVAPWLTSGNAIGDTPIVSDANVGWKFIDIWARN